MADIAINAVDRRVQFTGNTGTGPFAFTFNILADADIAVFKNDTLLTLTTDYTISTNADGTGSVSLTGSGNGTALIASDLLTVVGGRQLSRTTDFVTAGDLLASSLNEQLDSNVIMVQQLDEKIDRTIRIDQSDETADMVLPRKSARANKTLAFDSSGLPAVGEEIGDYRGDWAASTTYSIRDLVKDTSTNNIFRANAAHTSSGAQPLTTNTDSAKWDLIVDAAAATTSATAAASSATAAAASATAAAADAVSTAADVVSTAADVVTTGNNVTAAQAAQAAAELAADNFDDTYLGAKSSDPTVDNDGDALNAGDLYFNTTSNLLKVYNGSTWQAAAVSTTGLLAAANDLSDLNDAPTALTNLGLTATAAEINYNDITTLGLVEASKTVTADANAEITIPDDKKLYFGTDQDAHIRYDENTTDTLIVDGAKVKFGKAVRGNNFSSNATGSTTLSFETYQNFILTLTGAVTLANPTTETTGQTGFIIFIQDGTGNRVVSLGTDYETAGGSGLTLSTAASATDIVPYVVAANGRILLGTPQLAFA